MHDLPTKYLARAFVFGARHDVNAQAFVDLAARVGDTQMMPRPILEFDGSGRMQPRMGLGTPDNKWLLQITSEAVDVQWLPPYDKSIEYTFAQFCERAGRQLAGALDYLGLKAHRVATVQEGLLEELPESTMYAVARKLLARPAPFDVAEPFEWDWRAAVHVERDFGPVRSENTNTIAIARRHGAQLPSGAPIDRIFVSTDINTSPSRKDGRFGGEELLAFCSTSPQWHEDLSQGLLSLIRASDEHLH